MDTFIDFSKKPQWHDLFYSALAPDDPLVKELGKWLREHKNDFVRLYHGTLKDHPVMTEGLLPTNQSRRNSMQSRSGFVSVSVYEGHARNFAQIAYPGREIEIYAVTVCVNSLVADTDQLRNIRQWNSDRHGLPNTLVNSLVFGHGAQIKGRVEPRYLSPMSLVNADLSEDQNDECGPGAGFC